MKPAADAPRLRFDKVALALVRRTKEAVAAAVPDGKVVVFTVTAPIRRPSQTIAGLEDRIRNALARRSAGVSIHEQLHGNAISIWVIDAPSLQMSKVVGFVHNPETDPRRLLEMTRAGEFPE